MTVWWVIQSLVHTKITDVSPLVFSVNSIEKQWGLTGTMTSPTAPCHSHSVQRHLTTGGGATPWDLTKWHLHTNTQSQDTQLYTLRPLIGLLGCLWMLTVCGGAAVAVRTSLKVKRGGKEEEEGTGSLCFRDKESGYTLWCLPCQQPITCVWSRSPARLSVRISFVFKHNAVSCLQSPASLGDCG